MIISCHAGTDLGRGGILALDECSVDWGVDVRRTRGSIVDLLAIVAITARVSGNTGYNHFNRKGDKYEKRKQLAVFWKVLMDPL